VKIDEATLHLPHGHDRMSPGAQQEVKRFIQKVKDVVGKATSGTQLTFT